MTYYHSVVGILLRQHDQLINSGNQQGRKADNTIKGKEKMRNLFATTILLLLQIFGTILVSLLRIYGNHIYYKYQLIGFWKT